MHHQNDEKEALLEQSRQERTRRLLFQFFEKVPVLTRIWLVKNRNHSSPHGSVPGSHPAGMKTLRLWGLVGLLLVSTQSIYPQESPAFEKIRDVSPDGKFGLRISCSSEPEDPDSIDPNLITAAELVLLPSKIGRLQIT